MSKSIAVEGLLGFYVPSVSEGHLCVPTAQRPRVGVALRGLRRPLHTFRSMRHTLFITKVNMNIQHLASRFTHRRFKAFDTELVLQRDGKTV